MVVGLAFLDHQHRASCREQKRTHFVVDQRIGDVQHVQRHAAGAERVGQVRAARARAARCWYSRRASRCRCREMSPSIISLRPCSVMNFSAAGQRCSIFSRSVHERRRRQHDAAQVAPRVLQRILQRVARARGCSRAVKRPCTVARADAQLEHHRRVRRLRQLEAVVAPPSRSTAGSAAGRAARSATSSRRRACAPA